MADTPNLSIELPTVGGSTDDWGDILNTGTTALDALFSISGTDVTMSDIKFNSVGLQETGAGTDTVKIQAPSAVTQYTLTMPGAVGSDGQVLSADGGAGVLAWTTPVTGDITAIVAGTGLTGTSLDGPIPTLNVIGTANKITVDADTVTIASSYVGQTSITTLGTVGTGVWNGTAITGAFIDPTSSPLAEAKIWIGSGSNVAAEFVLSGDATMAAGGAVTVTAPAATLTGDTLASGVTASSLTSVGTIASLVATTADINAGTFDGIVGGTTPADGSFTTLSTSDTLTISSSGATGLSIQTGASSVGSIMFGRSGGTEIGQVTYDHAENRMHFTTNNAHAVSINDNGWVGIGTQSASTALHVVADGSGTAVFEAAAGGACYLTLKDNTTSGDPADPQVRLGSVGDTLQLWAGDQPRLSIAAYVDATGVALAISSGGDVDVVGAFTAASKTFKIDHPLPDKKDSHHLIHSCIEGPRADLVYRGSVDLSSGSAQVDLDDAGGMSAGTWELLCRDPQVWIQNDTGWSSVRGSVAGSTLTIESKDVTSDDTISWMVVAERCDPYIMAAESTDDDGHVIVEPEKEDDGA